MLRFELLDRADDKGKEEVLVGQATVAVEALRRGYRHVPLVSALGVPLLGPRIRIFTTLDEIDEHVALAEKADRPLSGSPDKVRWMLV